MVQTRNVHRWAGGSGGSGLESRRLVDRVLFFLPSRGVAQVAKNPHSTGRAVPNPDLMLQGPISQMQLTEQGTPTPQNPPAIAGTIPKIFTLQKG